jgi:predicted RNase H-like nuclease (RuvC/YqgF family)
MSQSIKQLQDKVGTLSDTVMRQEKRIRALQFQIKEYEMRGAEMEDPERNSLYSQIDHLHRSLIGHSQVVDMYQQWFARNAYWTQIHNNMMKYNPALGNYEHKGADEPIVIPEVEQWEVVKDIPPLSTVVEPEEEE